MSCYLSIIGADLDAEHFVNIIGTSSIKVIRKGEPRFKTQPDRGVMPYNVVNFLVSDAGMDNVQQQVADAEAFLRINFDKLTVISETVGVQFATLRFGVRHYIDRFSNDVYFPPPLMKLAGALGLSLELSSYTSERENEV